MHRWSRITPAVYGIAKRAAVPIIKAKWEDLITPYLLVEAKLYDYAYDSFDLARKHHQNAKTGLDLFKAFLTNDGFEADEIIPPALFDVYWDLASNPVYWMAHNQTRLVYKELVDRWDANNQQLVLWCEENLDLWLSGN